MIKGNGLMSKLTRRRILSGVGSVCTAMLTAGSALDRRFAVAQTPHVRFSIVNLPIDQYITIVEGVELS